MQVSHRRLRNGIKTLGLKVDQQRERLLLEYLGLMEKWGQTYNLTSIRDLDNMVTLHVLDSLAAAPYIKGPRVLDVGSGAGLPGFPLAIVFPRLTMTLVESRKNKAQFLLYAVSKLELKNIEVVSQRVEQYEPPKKFDTLIARAFAPIAGLVDKAGHLCASDGQILALKGRDPSAEVVAMGQDDFIVAAVHPVKVPGLTARRHIVVLEHRD